MLIYEIIFVYATRQVIKKCHKLGNTAILLQKGVKMVQNSTKDVIGRRNINTIKLGQGLEVEFGTNGIQEVVESRFDGLEY